MHNKFKFVASATKVLVHNQDEMNYESVQGNNGNMAAPFIHQLGFNIDISSPCLHLSLMLLILWGIYHAAVSCGIDTEENCLKEVCR